MPLINRLGGSGGGEHVEETIITKSGTYTVPATGTYRICAIGAGSTGRGYYDDLMNNDNTSGACGGGGYLVTTLVAGATYTVTIDSSKSSFGSLITATAGKTESEFDDDDNYSCWCISGTVSGTGVVAFSSNNKNGQKDIVPPDFWAHRSSPGGMNYNGTTLQQSGGAGLFGGPGGMGGHGRWSYENYSNYVFPPTSGTKGGGNGGASSTASGNYASHYLSPGGGGGGGYGGGGGAGVVNSSFNSVAGGAGSGCVFIEKIG